MVMASEYRLGIIGEEEDRGGTAFDTEQVLTGERSNQPLFITIGKWAQLQCFCTDTFDDQLTGPTIGDDLPLVHDHQTVTKPLGLIHVMSRDNEGDSALLQPLERIPDGESRLRVQASSWLIQDDQIRIGDQCSGNQEASLHPAGKLPGLLVGSIAEQGKLQQLTRLSFGIGTADTEVARLLDQTFTKGQLTIEVRLLSDHTDSGLHRSTLRDDVVSKDFECSSAWTRKAVDHPHRRRLACSIRPEKAETRPSRNREVDSVDRNSVAVALSQAGRTNCLFALGLRVHAATKAMLLFKTWIRMQGQIEPVRL